MSLLPALIYAGLVGGAVVLKINNKNKFDPSIHDYPESIEVKEAVKLIKNNYFDDIIDVRTQEEYDQGHLDNVILAESLASKPDTLKNILFLMKNKKSKILIYCRSGRRSMIAAKMMKVHGYHNVYTVVNGGYTELSKSM